MTAVNKGYNGSIPPNGSVGIGFNGTYTGTNTAPPSFTLNDITCATA